MTLILPLTTGATALSALGLLALSIPVSVRRLTTGIKMGAGVDPSLESRIRAQANYVEYVPLFLIALGIAEQSGAAPIAVSTAIALMLVGRLLHAIGMLTQAPMRPRAIGIVLTWAALLILAGTLIFALLTANDASPSSLLNSRNPI